MAENELDPGMGGAPTPEQPNALAPRPQPSQGPGMSQQFLSEEDKVEMVYKHLKETDQMLKAVRASTNKLLAYGDTITTAELVKGAGEMVAAGVPAAKMAGELADAPDNPEQLQQWVQQKSQELVKQEQFVAQALERARFALGVTAMRSMLGQAAEEHHQRRMLEAARPQGRMN